MISNSLDIDFIHGDIQHRSCKKIYSYTPCHCLTYRPWSWRRINGVNMVQITVNNAQISEMTHVRFHHMRKIILENLSDETWTVFQNTFNICLTRFSPICTMVSTLPYIKDNLSWEDTDLGGRFTGSLYRMTIDSTPLPHIRYASPLYVTTQMREETKLNHEICISPDPGCSSN